MPTKSCMLRRLRDAKPNMQYQSLMRSFQSQAPFTLPAHTFLPLPQTTYALTTSFIPVLQSLAATNNAVPAVVKAAPKIHIPVKLFSFPRMAPAMGVPANTPKLIHAKPIPIRVPIKARFCVRETKMEGGRDTNVPEKKPSARI